MTSDDLMQPITADLPCGPDLDATMDTAYDAYYFGALGRLPAYFAQPGTRRPDGSTSPDLVFDSSSVDITAERGSIAALLERSRDIRLLVLLAQWEALAGKIDALAATFDTLATLIETFGGALHPSLEGGPIPRRDALADLCNQATMIQPLLFYGLTGTDEVSMRKIKVAEGELLPLQSEDSLKSGVLTDALANPSNKKRVEDTQKALLVLTSGLERISHACQSDETAPFTPALTPLMATLNEMLDAIAAARPELERPQSESVSPEEQSEEIEPSIMPVEQPAAPSDSKIASHDEARMMLEACEHYYRRAEPSSATLLLITQARLLIGRPLIEALDALLPEKAAQTVIDFGPQTGFVLNMDRLRQLTDSAPQSAAPDPEPQPPAGPPPVIRSSAEAAGALHTVEYYFLGAEKSSPVPILLKRARSYLQRDFQSLVDELVPNVETNQ